MFDLDISKFSVCLKDVPDIESDEEIKSLIADSELLNDILSSPSLNACATSIDELLGLLPKINDEMRENMEKIEEMKKIFSNIKTTRFVKVERVV